ncbi:src kinase-associated phosphoprotein 2-like [Xenia sp. Carnegie-2017]|uniref:src kinase-associated phosphoprotein 2-like n=1 Tax=Xenia sp. Carnegie-2017 TaxID=2897299 RepID=UPI001F0411FB|nr:src kinase-associated phosphoprotein 2-like [Xenia sp. Carnegie-2017]
MAADESSAVVTKENTNDKTNHTREKAGYLLKRNKITNRWKKTWCFIKDRKMCYSNSAEETTAKSVCLEGCQIGTCEIKSMINTFYVKPKTSQRKYILCAESEEELEEWMQAIFLERCYGQKNSLGSEACVIQ